MARTAFAGASDRRRQYPRPGAETQGHFAPLRIADAQPQQAREHEELARILLSHMQQHLALRQIAAGQPLQQRRELGLGHRRKTLRNGQDGTAVGIGGAR